MSRMSNSLVFWFILGSGISLVGVLALIYIVPTPATNYDDNYIIHTSRGLVPFEVSNVRYTPNNGDPSDPYNLPDNYLEFSARYNPSDIPPPTSEPSYLAVFCKFEEAGITVRMLPLIPVMKKEVREFFGWDDDLWRPQVFRRAIWTELPESGEATCWMGKSNQVQFFVWDRDEWEAKADAKATAEARLEGR